MRGNGKNYGVAPAREHSVMVVRCPWGDVVLKAWAANKQEQKA